MIAVTEFHPEDLKRLDVQPRQMAQLPVEAREAIAWKSWELGPAWTASDAETGRVLFCGGFLVVRPHHAMAWCGMALGKGRALLEITHHARRAIAAAPWKRVELFTDVDFPAAGRWARALGMEQEGLRRAHGHDGGDQVAWVRILEGAG